MHSIRRHREKCSCCSVNEVDICGSMCTICLTIKVYELEKRLEAMSYASTTTFTDAKKDFDNDKNET